MINPKKIIKYLLNAVKADYVVEQGTSGIWTYRKWNSGIAECWGTYTTSISVGNSSSAYSVYRSGNIGIPAYPFTFTGTPNVTAVCANGNSMGAWLNHIEPSTTGGVFYLSAGASLSAANRAVTFHVIGKWK